MSDSIQVKIYPAGNGDSFLVKGIIKEELCSILVDGGYRSTFNNAIKSDLEEITELDLVIATHIDADHILGIIELFKNNGVADSPKIVKIKKVWHNSLRSITGECLEGKEHPEGVIIDILKRGFPTPVQAASSEISAKQGSSLASQLLSGKYNWNEKVGITPISSSSMNVFELSGDISILVLSPSLDRLSNLKNWWIKKLKQLGYFNSIRANDFYDDAFEFMCADEKLEVTKSVEKISHKSNIEELSECYRKDDSVVNGSSISFILHWKDKRLLFLADSWAEDIEAEIVKLSPDKKMIFDCIKVSHHGSQRNTSPALLEQVDAKIFLVSTSGDKHDHPDFSVLKAIVDRPADFERRLYFNYSTKASQELIKYSEHSEQKFEVFEAALDWIEI